ncbi:hypothetical protein PO909_031119 [Leuciscus waleckii]
MFKWALISLCLTAHYDAVVSNVVPCSHDVPVLSASADSNTGGVVYNLLWYRQYQRSKPELLLYMTESGVPVKADPSAHWFSAEVDKHRKLMELKISPAKNPGGSVLYELQLSYGLFGKASEESITIIHPAGDESMHKFL